MDWLKIVLPLVIGLLAGGVSMYFFGFKKGYLSRKQTAEAAISSAEEEAERIVDEAKKDAESKRKEIVLEGKEELHRLRSENDKEIRDRRNEINKQEKRVQQREEHLNKKIEQAEKKLEQYNARMKQADDKFEEAETLKRSQMEILEKISGFTAEQAKDQLMKSLEKELIHEKAIKIKEYEQQTKDEAEKKAQNIICNIRTLETVTGVDIIIDDTPEAITLSSFNPIRREVARIAMERLIQDGRIHPARIEEMVDKANREIEATIKEEGEHATLEANVMGLHPELIKLLGRLRFRTSYGQNVLKHSLEVSMIAGAMASELGIDPAPARRAGLLHDIGKGLDYEMEGSHVDIGVDMARKYREPENIIHAIAAHHGGVEATSIIDCLVQAADAVSAARPGARRENVESYIKRLQRLEEIAKEFEGVSESFAIQAGREVRVLVKPETITDDQMPFLAREICKKIESELDYPGQIKVNVIRESRASEYAK